MTIIFIFIYTTEFYVDLYIYIIFNIFDIYPKFFKN